MTTRPTDEEIRILIDGLRAPAYWFSGSSAGHEGENDRPLQAADALEAVLAERQASRDGVTDEMVDKAMLAWSGYYCDCNDANVAGNNRDAMLAALQSIAQPITSVSDALNFLEEWALAGNKLHGDDIQRFHATVERIAPVAKTVKVPEEKEDLDPVKLHRQGRFATEFERGFNEGWNDCREAMLSAAPAYNGKKEG